MFKTCLNLIIAVAIVIQPTFAQTYEERVSEVDQQLIQLADELRNSDFSSCGENLIEIYDLETEKFLAFITQHFQNKAYNSSLVNSAIAKYIDHKRTLKSYLGQLETQATREGVFQQQGEEFEAFFRCVEITDVYIEFSKDRLMEHVKSNSARKKTSALLEKHVSISNQLRELNLGIAQVQGSFQTFKNRLPGFLSQCLSL